MKKLIGIFNIRKNTPEQIYEKVKQTLEKREHTELLKMAKSQGKKK